MMDLTKGPITKPAEEGISPMPAFTAQNTTLVEQMNAEYLAHGKSERWFALRERMERI